MTDENGSGKGLLPESLRKVLATGLSAVFMTEEGIRNALGDMRLPKDAMAYVVQQTERTRNEFFRVVANEFKAFLKSADVGKELQKALKGLKLQIKAEVSFVKDTPDIQVKTEINDSDSKADSKE